MSVSSGNPGLIFRPGLQRTMYSDEAQPVLLHAYERAQEVVPFHPIPDVGQWCQHRRHGGELSKWRRWKTWNKQSRSRNRREQVMLFVASDVPIKG
jgi:hypothetical protein